MATKLEEFPASNNNHLGGEHHHLRIYPWEDWLNGEIWELKPGEDFKVSVKNLRTMIYMRATRQGLKVRTRIVGDTIVIQAMPKSDEDHRTPKKVEAKQTLRGLPATWSA